MVDNLTRKIQATPSAKGNHQISSDKTIPYLQDILSDIKIYGFDKINEYHRGRYFKYTTNNYKRSNSNNDAPRTVVSDKNSELAQRLYNSGSKVSLIKNEQFDEVLERAFAPENTIQARYLVDFISPQSCAKNIKYFKTLSLFLLLNILLFYYSPSIFIFINNSLYLMHNCFKSILFLKNENSLDNLLKNELPTGNQLPIYTVLVPLYPLQMKNTDFIMSENYH